MLCQGTDQNHTILDHFKVNTFLIKPLQIYGSHHAKHSKVQIKKPSEHKHTLLNP